MTTKLVRLLADDIESKLPNFVISEIENFSCMVRHDRRDEFRLRFSYLVSTFSIYLTAWR